MSTSHLGRNLRFPARIIAKTNAMGRQGDTGALLGSSRQSSALLPDKGNIS